MPNQRIGVQSTWSNKAFTPGLNSYLKSLTKAIIATNQTVATIANLGATLNNVFALTHTNSQLTVASLQAITNAAKRASTAITGINRRQINPRQPRGGAGAVTGGQTAAQIANTTRAARNLSNQARQTSVSLQGLSTQSIAVGTAIGTVVGNALLGLGRGLAQFGGTVLEIVTFFERMELSLSFFSARAIQAEDETISFSDALKLGASEAQGLSIWLQRLAVASPFTTRDVSTIFRTAQAYGLTSKEAQRLTPLLLDLGAAAGLDEDILLRVALALGQIRARGKLTGEEVRQLGNSSIPIRDILVKELGIANDQFEKLLENGAFTSDIVIPAITRSLETLRGAGEEVAFGTIGGIISAFDELREIGIAKFFTGALEPIKQSFQDLFKTLNQPEVLALITVLGQEMGVILRDAVLGTAQAIRNLVASWNALGPAMQQQIIVFGAATAGVFALIAATGLLAITVGLLFHPVSLIAITVGFLVSEWTSGFAVLQSITANVASAIGRSLRSMIQAIGAAISGFLNFISEINSGVIGVQASFFSFGLNIGRSLAEGIIATNGILASALRGLGKLLTFWLAPGSPPRIAPDIDDWGKATMQEYIDAFGQANVKKSLGGTMNIVSDTISDELIAARRQAVDELNQAHPDLGLTLAQDLNQMVKDGYAEAKDAFEESEPVEEAAAEAGIRVSDSFVESFLSRIPNLVPKMSKELADVLNKIGGGVQLTRAGALSFGRFLDGFGEADFGVLDETAGVVQEFLQSLVDTGEIEDVDLPRLLFGARESLAQGIKDIQNVGSVTESTMQRIRATAGGASKFVLQLLNSYAPLAKATDDVEEAQSILNGVTEKYKQILTPLRKELEAINEANQTFDEEDKILSLRRLIANEAVTDRRRANAQSQIDQIFAERRVRGLEKEREAATDTAQDELDSREKTRDALEEQFGALQANIQAQLTQLGLFSQESSIVRKLQEEAAKLREKEMTQDDLRLKFLELQGEELADLIEAARAKYDLDRADATVLEKEQAAITLAEIALRRRNREAEAIKLGIPVEELTKLRDFEVTLDDIGIKSEEAFDFEGDLSAAGQGIIDADALTREWEDTLRRVKEKWLEIKGEIIATATAINERLPSFLKIFPETEGEEPPIIQFIKDYGLAVVGLAIAVNTFKVAARLFAVGAAIRNLMTLGTLSGAAAGGAAAAAGTATGVAGAIAAITTAVLGLGGAALITTGYLIALKAAADAFVANQDAAAQANDKLVEGALGDATPDLSKITNNLIADVEVSGEAATHLRDTITTAAVSAIQDGFGDAHVAASVGNAVTRSIAEGLIADTPENRASIAAFQANLVTVLQGTTTGVVPKINFLTGAEVSATPTEEQTAAVKADVGTFLSGITDEEQKSTFALQMETLIRDAVGLGMTNAQIGTLVFGAFNEGVSAGLVSDTEENRKAITSYINGLVKIIQEEALIDSPSELTRKQIGVPLGEGILAGINAAFAAGSVGLVTTTKLMFKDLTKTFETGKNDIIGISNLLRVGVQEDFLALKVYLGLRIGEIVLAQRTGWTTVRTDADRETEAMRVDTAAKLEAIRAQSLTKMAEIKAVIVSAFTATKTDSMIQVGLMRTQVVQALAGEEDSLLSDLRIAFLGEDQLVPREIGRLFVEGLAKGITDNKQTLANAFISTVSFALGAASDYYEGLGPQSSVRSRTGTRPGTNNAAVTTNSSRISNYNLNVTSSQASQGIIQDFGIMRVLTN